MRILFEYALVGAVFGAPAGLLGGCGYGLYEADSPNSMVPVWRALQGILIGGVLGSSIAVTLGSIARGVHRLRVRRGLKRLQLGNWEPLGLNHLVDWCLGDRSVDIDDESAVLQCEAVGRSGCKSISVVGPLLELLIVSRTLRAHAAAALAMLGDGRLAQAITGTLEGKPEATNDLRRIITEGDFRLLEALLSVGYVCVYGENHEATLVPRMEVMEVAHRFGALEPAIEPLLASDKSLSVRERACRVLGLIGNERALDPLISLLDGTCPSVVIEACRALVLIGDLRATERLIPLLDNADGSYFMYHGFGGRVGMLIVKEACSALVKLAGPLAVEPLLVSLARRTELLRTVSPRRLGPWERDLFLERDALSAAAICDALGHLGDASAIETLAAPLLDPHFEWWPVLKAACRALGRQSDPRAIPALVAFICEPRCGVSEGERALMTFPDATIADQLISLALGGDLRGFKAVSRVWDTQWWMGRSRNIWEKVRERALSSLNSMLCPTCLVRAQETHVHRYGGLEWFACRACGRVAGFMPGVPALIAVLDDKWYDDVSNSAGTVRVNWFRRRALFDFDRVEILSASDYEVENLLVAVGNDTDEWRRARYPKMACAVGCALSENTLRNLRAAFSVGSMRKCG